MTNKNARDRKKYASSMVKSAWDKAFFMDKIGDASAVIDFGCADGAMIRFLAPLFPYIEFYGYDIDDGMIKLARERNECPNNVTFYGERELNKLIADVKKKGHKEVCLNLASVLHEVYSFPENHGIDSIRKVVESVPVKYITIRDMYFHTESSWEGPLKGPLKEAVAQCDREYVDSFSDVYGNPVTPKRALHFLMKYQWRDNGWEEELRENYFSWNLFYLLNDLGFPFETIYETHYLLPHLCYKWWKEYGVFIPNYHTHAQFILRRCDH